MRNPSGSDILNELTPFEQGYLEAAFWTEQDSLGELGLDDMGKESVAAAMRDCRVFEAANRVQLDLFLQDTGRSMEDAGHDFWLTRNGHGAGFWDRPVETADGGAAADFLTEACKRFGEVDLYTGDDGKVYVSNETSSDVRLTDERDAHVPDGWRFFDNGGKTADRYSIWEEDGWLSCSSNPFSSQGVGMHDDGLAPDQLLQVRDDWAAENVEVDFYDLPEKVREAIIQDAKNYGEDSSE